MDQDYYKRQIAGLLTIIKDEPDFISKDYIQSKLRMILGGEGINFHALLDSHLDKVEESVEEFISDKIINKSW